MVYYYYHLHPLTSPHTFTHSREAMEKSQKSQIIKLSLIALLFLITPLLSASMRPPYLYFLLNLLIIALGAEAGLLSILKPPEDKKPSIVIAPKPVIVSSVLVEASPDNKVDTVIDGDSPEGIKKKVKMVEKSVPEKIISIVKVHKVKKCPSTPSLFFIGEAEAEVIHEEEEEEEEEEGSLSEQELFTKAEMFIGNFYKQLKIQREDSWKKIHGFYQKAFE